MKTLISNNFTETIEIGYKIGSLLKEGDVLLLSGDLGAGKTTFTKGIGKALGINRTINSPTFTIVKEYNGTLDLYHLDLYRLDGLNNDFDLEDYIEGDGVCVIEWPFQVSEILPKQYLEIKIERVDEFSRSILVTNHGDRYIRVVEAL